MNTKLLQELHVTIDEFDNKSWSKIKAVLRWALHTFNLCVTSFIKHKLTEDGDRRQQRSGRLGTTMGAGLLSVPLQASSLKKIFKGVKTILFWFIDGKSF